MEYSHNDYNKNLKQFARQLRKNTTPGERKLWKEVLCDSKMRGHRFRRQRPIDKYIADFFCKELKLLIEIDGLQHYHQGDYDNNRDAKLHTLGYQTFRISHYQVITDIVNVSRSIEGKVIELENLLGLAPKPLT